MKQLLKTLGDIKRPSINQLNSIVKDRTKAGAVTEGVPLNRKKRKKRVKNITGVTASEAEAMQLGGSAVESLPLSKKKKKLKKLPFNRLRRASPSDLKELQKRN